MTLLTFRPVRNYESVADRIQKFFDDDQNFRFGINDSHGPRLDILEEDNSLFFEIELPGLKKENIKITLENNELTIEGTKKRAEKNERKYLRVERMTGTFKRTFTLPYEVDSNNVTANFNDGVLSISLKKYIEDRKTERTIEVN